MDNKTQKSINNFRDLDVYNSSYQTMLVLYKSILPKLPESEKYDLRDQLSRSSKAVPRLIAEGYSKRHQRFGFQKYLDDARAEANETIVGIEQCKDLYGLDPKLCNKSTDAYDKIARQLFNLAEAWGKFTNRRRKAPPANTTHRATQ